MSKLMRELAEAEERRKAEDEQLASDREGEAAALAWLADEVRGTAKATETENAQREAQEVARRRIEAEAAAVEQARARLKAEIAARAATLERVALERDRRRIAEQLIEAESMALAEAERREQAAAALRDAIAARLESEKQAKAAADARVAIEQAALQATNEKIRMERDLEATTLARTAAERDAVLLAEQNQQFDADLAEAEDARREAEFMLGEATTPGTPMARPLAVLEDPTIQVGMPVYDPGGSDLPAVPAKAHSAWPYIAAGALLAGVAIGWMTAGGFDSEPPAIPAPEAVVVTSTAPVPPAAEAPATLNLDADFEAFGRRVEAPAAPEPAPSSTPQESQDNSLRRVNPSASQ